MPPRVRAPEERRPARNNVQFEMKQQGRGAEMPNDPQVPWTDEQWARVNQVIQEEASRARVAASFLPLSGPLPPDTDFVRAEIIPDPVRR